MAVCHGDSYALRREIGSCCGNDFVADNFAPKLQRLFFAFFFFAADVGDNVINHFGPTLKGFAGARNCLIGANKNVFHAVFFIKREKRGNISL